MYYERVKCKHYLMNGEIDLKRQNFSLKLVYRSQSLLVLGSVI